MIILLHEQSVYYNCVKFHKLQYLFRPSYA